LKRHRNTIREKVRSLLTHRTVDRPVIHFLALFREYPLLVVAYADLPDDEKVSKWIREDRDIFACKNFPDLVNLSRGWLLDGGQL